MKKLFFIVVLVVISVGLPLLGLNDTVISSDDTAPPNNEPVGSITRTSNCSASATITITMTGILDE